MATEPSAQHLAAGIEQCLRLFRESRLETMEALAGELAQTYPSAGRVWQMLGIARLARGNGDVVEEAETHRPRPLGMVTGRPDRTEAVLDFAAGSGTTGIAARNTGRQAILIEKEARYCDLIRSCLLYTSDAADA